MCKVCTRRGSILQRRALISGTMNTYVRYTRGENQTGTFSVGRVLRIHADESGIWGSRALVRSMEFG